jgi:NAD(P) transhydrogenase subunit alpha
MAAHASQLYAKNLENFIDLITTEDGGLDLDFDDEVVAGACLTDGGEIKNERARSVVEGKG